MHYLNLSIENLNDEIWADIIGFEGLYQVSNMGRVKSTPKIQNGYKARIRKQGIDNRGYLRVCVGKDSIKSTFKVHRLVAEYFVSNPNNYDEVNHKKGNKFDNRATEIEWSNRSLNIQHGFDSGLMQGKKGDQNVSAIISNKMALDIFNSTLTPKNTALLFGIKITMVYDIRSGRSFSSITGKVYCKRVIVL